MATKLHAKYALTLTCNFCLSVLDCRVNFRVVGNHLPFLHSFSSKLQEHVDLGESIAMAIHTGCDVAVSTFPLSTTSVIEKLMGADTWDLRLQAPHQSPLPAVS